MVGGNISSEKVDLLVYGPSKPIVNNGFSDQFVLHPFETKADLERLTPAVAAKIRGAAVTYNTVRGDSATLARFPRLEIGRGLERMQHELVGKTVIDDRLVRAVDQQVDLLGRNIPGHQFSFPSALSCQRRNKRCEISASRA